jgi:hypothetical protein
MRHTIVDNKQQCKQSKGATSMHGTKLKLSVVVLTAVMTAGCAGSTVNECPIFKPIRGSSKDTPETRKQVDQHNGAGVGACGWKAQ